MLFGGPFWLNFRVYERRGGQLQVITLSEREEQIYRKSSFQGGQIITVESIQWETY